MVVRGVGVEKVVAADATTAAGVTVEQKPGVYDFNTFLRWQAMKTVFVKLLGVFVGVECLLISFSFLYVL